MAFGSLADVDAWLAEPGNSKELLWERIKIGTMSGDNASWGRLWMERFHVEQEAAHTVEMRELNRRATIAAETSAKAAETSANWSRWAAVIAVAALAISGMTYIKG